MTVQFGFFNFSVFLSVCNAFLWLHPHCY